MTRFVLTHAGISTKDQTVYGKEYKKDDRVFLDIEASNVDVCFFFFSTLYLVDNLTSF